jgi:ABC-type phosphate/phosphonate transport system substrate-binding protein
MNELNVVTLPMYDLPEVRSATSVLLERITENLSKAGWPTRPTFLDFADHAALVRHWRDPQTALSHSCGLPYIEALVGDVQVLGTFLWKGVSGIDGRYRSVLITRSDDDRTIADLAGARPIINNPESLSGWCSLGVALHNAGYGGGDFPDAVVSGGHSRSVALVSRGEADVAAIDGATYRLLERHRPEAVAGVHVIGVGPDVPATPLITRSPARRSHGDFLCAAGYRGFCVDGSR